MLISPAILHFSSTLVVLNKALNILKNEAWATSIKLVRSTCNIMDKTQDHEAAWKKPVTNSVQRLNMYMHHVCHVSPFLWNSNWSITTKSKQLLSTGGPEGGADCKGTWGIFACGGGDGNITRLNCIGDFLGETIVTAQGIELCNGCSLPAASFPCS